MREAAALSPHASAARGAIHSVVFPDCVDLSHCALEGQLEQLHHHYVIAARSADRALAELTLLEKRDDISDNILLQARRQCAAARTRSANLLRIIEALEHRQAAA